MNVTATGIAPPRALPGRFANTAPAEERAGPRGSVFLYRPKRGLVFTQVVGHLDLELARGLGGFMRRQLEEGRKLDAFHDWWDMQSYDSPARIHLTEVVVTHRRLFGNVVLLTNSRIVAMGVATANIATSAVGVTLASHIKRQAFEKKFLEVAEN